MSKHYTLTSQSGKTVAEFDAANPAAARRTASEILRGKNLASSLGNLGWTWHPAERAWIIMGSKQHYYIESASTYCLVTATEEVRQEMI